MTTKTLQYMLLATAAAALAACATPYSTPDVPATKTRLETVQYRCADAAAMSVTYTANAQVTQAEMSWDGHVFLLPRDSTGTDGRYTDGTLTLVEKGDEAFVEKAGLVVLKDCNAKL